jgi:hypothetical protein
MNTKGALRLAVASIIAASVGVAYSATPTLAAAAQAAETNSLLLVGPVEALVPKEQLAIVLGQKISIRSAEGLAVGDTAAVFGRLDSNGAIIVSLVRNQGFYVPGSTAIVVTGLVQKSDASVGRLTVNGLTIDLTPAMSERFDEPSIGSRIQVVGTQPAGRGIVLANGISGSGLSGISGSGLHGISGSGLSGISGSGLHGISGSGLSGISGSGLHGISGSGLYGISGSGLSGISGSGLSGISGSGLHGISGSGLFGISGSGLSGISGSGLHGISGSGLSGISGSGLHGISGSGLFGISGSGLSGISGSGL